MTAIVVWRPQVRGRPEHLTRRAGKAQLEDCLEPASWVYSDYELRLRVQRALATDRFLRLFNVHLMARQGVVILTGIANTRQDRERATLDAKAAGALTVVNLLRVRG